jgi:3,4-dihydroxy-2-butanone 4-phosphate synthase
MEDTLAAFARGEFLVVMDDENRENEGDLIIAASLCTTEKMAWMIKHTRYDYQQSLGNLRMCLISRLAGTYVLPSLANVLTNWKYLLCFLQIKNDTERRIWSRWITKRVRRNKIYCQSILPVS